MYSPTFHFVLSLTGVTGRPVGGYSTLRSSAHTLKHRKLYSDSDKNRTICDTFPPISNVTHQNSLSGVNAQGAKGSLQVQVLNPAFEEWRRARWGASDLTQSELAELVGCAEDTIGRIEAGTRRPSKQVAALLADALGVPLQSQGDFVRFAREGGFSVGGLEPINVREVIRVHIVPRVIVLIVKY
jgi:DNA-binding XRE family transcriptional regulator